MKPTRPNRNGLKGPTFKSFTSPPHPLDGPRPDKDRALPEGKVWLAHDGRRARLRHLRQVCRPIVRSLDPEVMVARASLFALTQHEPEPEYGFLHLIFAAMEASSGTEASWAQSAEYLAGKFAAVAHLQEMTDEAG